MKILKAKILLMCCILLWNCATQIWGNEWTTKIFWSTKNLNYSSVIEVGSLRSDPERLCRLSKEILLGVMYIHSKKVVHCDLKPDNILLSDEGRIKISDFGLSTTTKSVIDRYRSDSGSYSHIAPELLDKNTRNRNVDIYSFGIILFEMCYGPFASSSERSRMLKMVMEEPDIPSRLIYDPYYYTYTQVCLFSSFLKLYMWTGSTLILTMHFNKLNHFYEFSR